MTDAATADHHHPLVFGERLYRGADLATQLGGALEREERIDGAGQVHRNARQLVAQRLLRRLDHQVMGNADRVVDAKRARHGPVETVIESVLGNEAGQLLVVLRHQLVQPRQRAQRTLDVAGADQVARQALGAEQDVVIVADDHHRCRLQLDQTPRAFGIGSMHRFALRRIRRLGRHIHHRVVRHPEGANDLAHGSPLQSSREGCVLLIDRTEALLVQPHAAVGRQLLPEAHGQHRIDTHALQCAHLETQQALDLFLAQTKLREEDPRILPEAVLARALHRELPQHPFHQVPTHRPSHAGSPQRTAERIHL
ncbi:hypothetical protein D9M71_471030 [compost metagenome]